MFKDNTVFVIGAGASAEFGLPVGWELTQTIKKNCDLPKRNSIMRTHTARELEEYYKRSYLHGQRTREGEYDEIVDKSHKIRDGIESAESIDEYIFRYSDDKMIAAIGKMQIAYAISQAENASILGRDTDLSQNIDVADNTWLWLFTKSLIRGVKSSETNTIGQNIKIICFNYDRCIEHYLEHAIVRSFHHLTRSEARGIVSNMNILHPYGTLGTLDQFPFGDTNSFAAMAENVVTWSETIKEPETIDQMKLAIQESNQIVFLGFGFAKQNMELLTALEIKKVIFSKPMFYATALGYTKATEDSLSEKIKAIYSEPQIEGLYPKLHLDYESKCEKFFSINRMNFEQ